MNKKTKAVIISASPKTSGKITSTLFAQLAADAINQKNVIASCIDVRTAVRKGGCDAAFAKMHEADALVFVFPLYFFCLPGLLMRFLQEYTATAKKKNGQSVWCIVNCGFYEPDINDEAVRVIQSFCRHIGAKFRFGITIACGSMVAFMRNARFMKKASASLDTALASLADDVSGEGNIPSGPIRITANINRGFYYFMAHLGWKRQAGKNGLKKKQLYARPYANS